MAGSVLFGIPVTDPRSTGDMRPLVGGSGILTGCRVVTLSMSARLLLGGQLRGLKEIRWSLVSGDGYADAPPDLTVHHVPMRRELGLSDLRSILELYRFFRAHRFSFVQTHTQKASLLGLPAARCAGLPTLYTMHGCLYFKDNTVAQNAVAWVFERWCCAWAGKVLCQSREDAATLPRARICRSAKVVHIGNGIDLDRFSNVPLPAGEGAKPVVMMVSRLVAEKGCRDFFAVARALHAHARFVHVGPTETDQRDAIPAAEIEDLSRTGVVEFRGAVDDVAAHLAEADVTLLPSYREGIPRVAMEAAAMGRAVAGYDVRGMREVIPPHLGLLVRRRDIPRLTEVVRRLVDDREHRETLGHACRQWVASNFSEDAVLGRLRAVYADFEPVR
ncbi:MAG TPA: glycosyltransferase family 4 protein [Acidimicrobiales bacterium]|nr:glycosyltransferase family 4 protein [Acidimicrobiales bacterium]